MVGMGDLPRALLWVLGMMEQRHCVGFCTLSGGFAACPCSASPTALSPSSSSCQQQGARDCNGPPFAAVVGTQDITISLLFLSITAGVKADAGPWWGQLLPFVPCCRVPSMALWSKTHPWSDCEVLRVNPSDGPASWGSRVMSLPRKPLPGRKS